MLDKPIEAISIVVLDVETTGMEPSQGARVCELAAVKVADGVLGQTFESLVNPEIPIDGAAYAVHHISSEMVRSAPTMAAVMPQFLAFIEGSAIAAYNAPFDMGFLNRELARTTVLFQEPGPVIDVLLLAKRCLPQLGRYPLWNVARHFQIDFPQQHRALQDAKVAAEALLRLLPLAREQGIRRVGDFVGLAQQRAATTVTLSEQEQQAASSIQRAIGAGTKVTVSYLASDGQSTERQLTPLELRMEAKGSYLVAFCHLRNEERTFRLDRILRVEPESVA